jgi:hypothetical protein
VYAAISLIGDVVATFWSLEGITMEKAMSQVRQ